MKGIEDWKEEYKDKYCAYIINNSDNINMNEKIKISNTSIKDFLQSQQFFDIEEKYQNCDIKLRIMNKTGYYMYSIKDKKFYDNELNTIIITGDNQSKYLIRGDIEIIHNMDDIPKSMTLKEYIDIMEDCKVFHIFKHLIHIDNEINDLVTILFGEKEPILLDDNGYKLEDEYTYYDKQIIDINLDKD